MIDSFRGCLGRCLYRFNRGSRYILGLRALRWRRSAVLRSSRSTNGSWVQLLRSSRWLHFLSDLNVEEVVVFRAYWAFYRPHWVLTMHRSWHWVTGALLQTLMLLLWIPVLVVIANILEGIYYQVVGAFGRKKVILSPWLFLILLRSNYNIDLLENLIFLLLELLHLVLAHVLTRLLGALRLQVLGFLFSLWLSRRDLKIILLQQRLLEEEVLSSKVKAHNLWALVVCLYWWF
jgi:hypothetical protein